MLSFLLNQEYGSFFICDPFVASLVKTYEFRYCHAIVFVWSQYDGAKRERETNKVLNKCLILKNKVYVIQTTDLSGNCLYRMVRKQAITLSKEQTGGALVQVLRLYMH